MMVAKVRRQKSGVRFQRNLVRSVGSVRSMLFGALLLLSACMATPARASFGAQREAMSGTIATQPEAAILSLLQAGLDEGKAVPAIAEARKWLAQNRPENAMLFFYAGKAAEYSGDWKGAVSLYQQYLADADLSSAEVGEAVYAVYALLIYERKDSDGAYNFSKNDGHRLVSLPQARQFDRWFLDRAREWNRNDVESVIRRLDALVEAGVSTDLILTYYDEDFRWLVDRLEMNLTSLPNMSKALLETCKRLAAGITFSEELQLRLDWAASVAYYNQAKMRDEVVQPPLAEARALLSAHPEYAKHVQEGWLGGSRSLRPGSVGDLMKFWPHAVASKMEVVVEAISSMTDLQKADFFVSWEPRYYSDTHGNRFEPHIRNVQAVKDYVEANPDIRNSRFGPLLIDHEWNKLSVEEAKALSSKIVQNPEPMVSGIRAYAAEGKDYEKAVDALIASEMWRFQSERDSDSVVDRLWHACGRPGGGKGRDEGKNKAKAAFKEQTAGDPGPEASAKQRVDAFKSLLSDYQSQSPRQPNGYNRAKRILSFSPELVPVLLKSEDVTVQRMLRSVLAAGIRDADGHVERDDRAKGLNTSRYDPWIENLADRQARGRLEELKSDHPKLYAPHALGETFRMGLSDGIKQNNLVAWQVMVWINLQFPDDNAADVELLKALQASSQWKDMPFEVKYAVREWFGSDALTSGQNALVESGQPEFIQMPIKDLSETSTVADTAKALGLFISRLRDTPVYRDGIQLHPLSVVSDEVLFNAQVLDRLLQCVSGFYFDPEQDALGRKLHAYFSKNPDARAIHLSVRYVIKTAVANHNRGRMFGTLVDFGHSIVDTHPASAAALARNGIQVFSVAKNIYGFEPSKHIAPWKSLDVKASTRIGLMTIPVAKTDPAYPVYESQIEWMSGNEDSAWQLCAAHWDEFMLNHREFPLDYLMWVLQRTIYSRDETKQEALITSLQDWASEENTTLSKERQVEIELAYGEIAIQKGMLRQAHEIFKRTAQKDKYDGLLIKHEATLRKARVERLAKDYDGALNTLNELALEKVPELWSSIHYAMAEVYYDMEEYDDANDKITSILARDSEHSDARIMQGRLQLKRKKLMEATEVELGTISSKQTLVPGEKLKVTLTDPTLAVSGAGTEIEVAVWAKSGDRELIFLRQFGDQKTKFRGEVRTSLGAPAKDDGVLQVIGDDEVYYAYSERFREKMNNMEEQRGGPIGVASDALLMASGRRLLSAAEQRVADMKAQMDALKDGTAGAVKASMASEVGERMMQGERIGGERTEADIQARLKPGNPIHVRVIDHDRSRTADVDELAVSASTSSGDSIGRFVLKETGTHTGWFEGQISTTGAQAKAYGANSEPGRNPNMVISPVTDYPPWQPVDVKGVTPDFRVDLNDNAPLGKMTIIAREPGAKLRSFIVQTGMHDRDWTTVGYYPKSGKNKIVTQNPWAPSVFVTLAPGREHHYGTKSIFEEFRRYQKFVDVGWMREVGSHKYGNAVATNVTGVTEALPATIEKAIDWKRSSRWERPAVITRFQAYFYEPENVTRRFRLNMGKRPKKPSDDHKDFTPEFMLVIDGRVINEQGKPVMGGVNLRAGVHRMEIWTAGWVDSIGFGRSVKLLANLENTEDMVEVPDAYFDSATFPEGVLTHRNSPAKVSSNSDGTQFSVDFARNAKARLIRLVFVQQEGPVPVLNRLLLAQPDGTQILPVKQDYAELNKNEILEILTGDKVAVRYVDDRFVAKNKQNHERFLDVAFSNAELTFEFLEMRRNRRGEMEPHYERQLRFRHGQPFFLTLEDPDMDVSAGIDSVPVTVKSNNGSELKLALKESEEDPGTFRAEIIPVSGAPSAENEISVDDGGHFVAVYRDMENTDPGVPTDRIARIENAKFQTPILRVSHSTVKPIDFKSLAYAINPVELNPGFDKLDSLGVPEDEPLGLAGRGEQKISRTSGKILPRWQIFNQFGDARKAPKEGFHAVHGQRMYFEVEAPHLALRMGSTVNLYVQTEAGRKAKQVASAAPDTPFDISVPGTMKLDSRLALLGPEPGQWRATPEIPIYVGGNRPSSAKKDNRGKVQNTGLFLASVPLIAGVLPEEGVLNVTRKERHELGIADKIGLVVRPNENIYIGFQYTDESGTEKWVTSKAKVITHPVMDVLEENYRTKKAEAYVGENLYVRVVDLGGDISDSSDTVKVRVQAKSGARFSVDLLEVGTHSGVFKAPLPLTYARRGGAPDDYNVLQSGFPVVYGDLVASVYMDGSKQKTPLEKIKIRKGADGSVRPFTKQYEDQEMAMQTQFALAEAYLEMAKNRRAQGDEEQAAREYDQARRLLASVSDQFKEPATRSHAEYLLGNLTQEEADATERSELQQNRYRAALARFMRVTGSYPDTEHASMAQFKIATIYEKLGEPDIAAQEYVKLAYKYPQSQFLALAMARLGTHFLKKASVYEQQAKALLAQTGDRDAQFEGTALQKMAEREYVNAGSIFSRMLERFPSHELAGQCGLRAGQAYMRAASTRQALQTFLVVVENESYDGPDIRAQAMYWAGMCYEKMREPMAAYAIYKRLTFDFPESKWASFARGQLSQDRMLVLETDLEMQRLEEEQ